VRVAQTHAGNDERRSTKLGRLSVLRCRGDSQREFAKMGVKLPTESVPIRALKALAGEYGQFYLRLMTLGCVNLHELR
jgi:hypothetical protein